MISLLKQFYFSLFFGKRFFRVLSGIVFLFIVSYGIPVLFPAAQILLILFALLTTVDYFLLFTGGQRLLITRRLPDRFSNGDENEISWSLTNNYHYALSVQLIDEFPGILQIRDFKPGLKMPPGSTAETVLKVFPKQRGELDFGNVLAFCKTPIGLIVRRRTFPATAMVKVYPSFLRLRQFEFLAHITDPGNIGFKQVRKTGHSLEFEQIREYVPGDDIRSINWRATGKTGGQLMINSYTDERSQQIYCIIDKGRVMKMPFGGLTLLDYAVNATLTMTGVALARQDKAGLISFSEKGGDFLAASHRPAQMNHVLQSLYNMQTRFLESDYSFLYGLIKKRIPQRSLLMLFTNFESLSALQRQLPYLRHIARKHLLLVLFFENTGLEALATGEAERIDQLYEKVIAEKYMQEKKAIVKALQQYGIHALLTAPEKLTVDAVNRYLQIKARREI